MSVPQPVPPHWKDLGKSSGDLLGKDFPIVGTSLEVKTKTPSNVTFKVAGNRDAKTAAVAGDIEAKYADPKKGITFTQTWTTTNILRSNIELENQIAKGLKIDLTTSLLPDKSQKSVLINTIYKQPGWHTRAVVDLLKGPTFTADTVLGRDGFLLGAEAAYDVTSGKITRYASALGYSAPDYAVTLHALDNLNTYSVSYYHRVNRDVEAGAKAIYNSKAATSGINLEVGAKAYLDSAAFVKAKINSQSVLVMSYTQALRPGVKASFGLAVDTAKLNDVNPGPAAHRVGASFTFEG